MNKEKKYVFALEPNEEYSERCGEVFLTNIGYLVFHCTLCDMKYKGFEKFADHIRDEHLLSSNYSDSFLDSELGGLTYDYDYDYNYADVENQVHDMDIVHVEENFGGHVDFEFLDENDTSSIMEVYSEANDTQSIEDSESGIKTDEDISPNTDDQNDVSSNEMENFSEEPVEVSNMPNIRPIRPMRKALCSRSPPDERKHKCSICGTTFKDKHNLNHHLLRHSNAKNFPCEECGKKFFTAAERRVHMRSHTQERPYLCNECGLRFVTNVLLVNHMKRHNSQPEHPCPYCEKSFFEKGRLTAHLYAHSDKKPYTCRICGSGYMHSRSLKNHMETHANT